MQLKYILQWQRADFENDPYDLEWRNNDDDDDDDQGDETTPFIPGSASTPGPSGEEIEMKTMKRAGCQKPLMLIC